MADAVSECSDKTGAYLAATECPFNSAPSRVWAEAVDNWAWQLPDGTGQYAWKEGQCPRCGHSIVVRAEPDGATGVAFDASRPVYVYCNCGHDHPGKGTHKGCGQAADIRPPEVRDGQ